MSNTRKADKPSTTDTPVPDTADGEGDTMHTPMPEANEAAQAGREGEVFSDADGDGEKDDDEPEVGEDRRMLDEPVEQAKDIVDRSTDDPEAGVVFRAPREPKALAEGIIDPNLKDPEAGPGVA